MLQTELSVRCVQAMSSDRLALMVRHEAVLRRLEEALQENNDLQAVLLEQSHEVPKHYCAVARSNVKRKHVLIVCLNAR